MFWGKNVENWKFLAYFRMYFMFMLLPLLLIPSYPFSARRFYLLLIVYIK